MRRFLLAALAVWAFGFSSSSAWASADSTCYPDWRISNSYLSCDSMPAISPGNDSRANLLMLMRDRQSGGVQGEYPEPGWNIFGRNYFNWSDLRQVYAPRPKAEYGSQYGTRCQSFDGGTKAFSNAVSAARKISKKDRVELTRLRAFLSDVCDRSGYRKREAKGLVEIVSNADSVLAQANVKGKAAKDFLAYLRATNDFYGGNYGEAITTYKVLGSSKNAWVKETAKYMVGRSHVNAAMKAAFSKWGFFDGLAAVKKSSAFAAGDAFKAYLSAYPNGEYAASANGLIRRAHWLSSDFAALSDEYHRMLGVVKGPQAADLIEEIDVKLLSEKFPAAQISGPELLATIDLMRMRKPRYRGDGSQQVSLADLESQRGAFRGREDLHDFLLANHALYVRRDARKVLKLIPDAARQKNFSHLEFSRQALRGTALSVLKDRNEGGFWRDMLSGSKALYQRPMVELALATFYEQNGQLEKVFADNSPITEAYIRESLLQTIAGPDILRRTAQASNRSRHERDLALFTLLFKQLSYGNYSGFLLDRKLARADGDVDAGVYSLIRQDEVPIGLFGSKAQRGEYGCPPLWKVATTLSRSSKDSGALLCLGDFWMANGLDRLRAGLLPHTFNSGEKMLTPQLSSSKTLFPGTAMPRHDIYTTVIASRSANADQKAYALYRAIRCYATSGRNHCGGKDASQPQRKAWFQKLKRGYPSSKWAKKLKYYW